MAENRPEAGPSLFQRLRGAHPGRPLLALLAAAIALIPPLAVRPSHPPASAAPAPHQRPAAGPAISLPILLSHIAARLPASDRLHLAMRDTDGTLVVETDTPDPEALRTAYAGDTMLRGLATVAETILPEGGMRVRMARPGLPEAGPPAKIDPRAAGLLVERTGREIAISGTEAVVIGVVARLGASADPVGFAGWRIDAAGGGAVRLTGMPVKLAQPVRMAPPSRPLFGEAAAISGAPEVAGIVGRLGRDAVALVRGPDGGVVSIAIGASVQGWRLETLSADAALFSRGGERVRVPMPEAE